MGHNPFQLVKDTETVQTLLFLDNNVPIGGLAHSNVKINYIKAGAGSVVTPVTLEGKWVEVALFVGSAYQLTIDASVVDTLGPLTAFVFETDGGEVPVYTYLGAFRFEVVDATYLSDAAETGAGAAIAYAELATADALTTLAGDMGTLDALAADLHGTDATKTLTTIQAAVDLIPTTAGATTAEVADALEAFGASGEGGISATNLIAAALQTDAAGTYPAPTAVGSLLVGIASIPTDPATARDVSGALEAFGDTVSAENLGKALDVKGACEDGLTTYTAATTADVTGVPAAVWGFNISTLKATVGSAARAVWALVMSRFGGIKKSADLTEHTLYAGDTEEVLAVLDHRDSTGTLTAVTNPFEIRVKTPFDDGSGPV